jgi:hypothetical protein
MTDRALREFLYLDGNLTRSLLAQLEGGVIEQLSRSKEARQQSSGGLKGEIPLLASAEAAGEVGWGQSEAETRILHDYMFNTVEAAMRKRASFLDLSSGDQTARDRCAALFAGQEAIGRFLLIRGRILLKDYGFLTLLIDNYHPVMEAVNRLSLSAQQKEGAITKKEARVLVQKPAGSFSRESAKQIKEVLQWLHGDHLVLQVRPSWDLTKAFETDLEDQWLRFTRHTLRFRYGVRFQGDWNVLCQVASVPSSEGPLPPLPELEQLKQALDTLFESLRAWIAYTHVTAPVVSVVPVAIYRDLM